MFCVFMFVASSYLLRSLPPSLHPSFPPLPPSFLPSLPHFPPPSFFTPIHPFLLSLLPSLPPSLLISPPSFLFYPHPSFPPLLPSLPSLPPSFPPPSFLFYPHPSFPPLPPSFLPSSLLFLLFYRPPVYVLPHLSHPFSYSPITVLFLRVSLFPLSPSFSFFWSSPEFWNPEYCHPLLLKAWMHERKVWLQKNFVNSPLTYLALCLQWWIYSKLRISLGVVLVVY